MTDIQQRRRNAHYNTDESPSQGSKKETGRVFFRIVVCMIILFFSFYCGSYTLPGGKTVSHQVSHIITYDSDFAMPFRYLRNFISRQIGQIPLPAPRDSSVFNETTPVDFK